MTASRPLSACLRSLATAAVVAAALPLGPARAADAIRLRPMVSLYVDGEAAALREPESVACESGGIAVADSGNGRIVLYSSSGGVVSATASFRATQAAFPISVAFAGDGTVLAVDGRSRRIARLSRTGEFLGYLAPSDPEVAAPIVRAIDVGPDGLVYALDVGHRRILALSLDGAIARTIAFPETAGFVSDIAVDGSGDVYAVDAVARRVLVARAGEEALSAITDPLTEDMDFPTALAVDGDHRVFVVDTHGSGIVFFGRDGTFRGRQLAMGWKEGFLRYPSGICVDEAGRLFIAERGNNRVQVFEIR